MGDIFFFLGGGGGGRLLKFQIFWGCLKFLKKADAGPEPTYATKMRVPPLPGGRGGEG